MATKIRFKRIGRRNRPFYRLVVIDSRKRRDGAPIEQLGWYDPIKTDKDSNFRKGKINQWNNILTENQKKIIENNFKKIMEKYDYV